MDEKTPAYHAGETNIVCDMQHFIRVGQKERAWFADF
jgi:hypothetical protein